MMKQLKLHCFVVMFVVTVNLGAQGHNSVPLDHAAYEIIMIGVIRGVISAPPSAKPWSESLVRGKLWEMINDSAQVLSPREVEVVTGVMNSFERKPGLDTEQARYRSVSNDNSFEAGLGWESSFSVHAGDGSISSINLASVYTSGDFGNTISWNITAQGGLLYIERDNLGAAAHFPYSLGRQWDGGVLSFKNPGTYTPWPDDPSLAYNWTGEVNAVSFDGRMQLRLGRIRRDWGQSGSSLVLNAYGRPFAALEGTYSPFSWMNVSVLGGALEHYRENNESPNAVFTNMLTMAQIEFNPARFFHFNIGGSAVLFNQVNGALFTSIGLRIPGLLALWGNLFVDSIDSFRDNFFQNIGNSFAYQAGIYTAVNWIPLGVFTFSYTRIEPYCYTFPYERAGWGGVPSSSAFVNSAGALGSFLPPNSDELLLRLESWLFPSLKAHLQFQSMRHGADTGDGKVYGSSLQDKLHSSSPQANFFLKDGVYRWDAVIRLGGTFTLRAGAVPLALFLETGFSSTRFTINSAAGTGNEGQTEDLENDPHYRSKSGFIFSIGFRLFSR